MDQIVERRSRRQMLFGGLAAVAGVALGRFAQPEPAAAATGQPVLLGAANTADAETTITNTSVAAVGGAFSGAGREYGIRGGTTGGSGVIGESVSGFGVVGATDGAARAGVIGLGGGAAVADAGDGLDSGVVGVSESGTTLSTGVWGHSKTGSGVVGTGPWGVLGSGGVGVTGDVAPGATGVYGFVGTTAAPIPTANVAVEARVASTSHLALNVVGRAKFSRSGRTLIGASKSSIVISLAGVTTGSLVFANLFTSRPGVWVAAATPGTNSVTIRLNKALGSSAYVVWFVLN